jgi:hypothetical protein
LDTTDYEEEMYDQICKDVPRTSSDIPLFHYGDIRTMLTRILYIWAMKHPASVCPPSPPPPPSPPLRSPSFRTYSFSPLHRATSKASTT